MFGYAAAFMLRPQKLEGRYANGTIAWEQWERRNWRGDVVHFRTTRYYPNGRVSLEFDGKDTRCWDPNGRQITVSEWYIFFLQNGGESVISTEP